MTKFVDIYEDQNRDLQTKILQKAGFKILIAFMEKQFKEVKTR